VRPLGWRPQRARGGGLHRHFARPSSRARQPIVAINAATSALFDTPSFSDMPYEAREAVMAAMERLGCKATTAEVAREAGLSIAEAERCLQSLANDCAGTLKVRRNGATARSLTCSLACFERSWRLSNATPAPTCAESK
jgi:hypothetical protein